jgi:trigger factor
MNVGETREVKVTLPEDFEVKEIAGMDVVYEVELKAIKRQILSDLDDEFARRTKLADDLASLRAALRERLEGDLQSRIERIKQEQIVGYLNSKVAFELPKELIGQAAERRVQQLVQENQERGVSDDQIIEHQQEILTAANQQAQFDVKTEFILKKIADAEEIEVTHAEVAREIVTHALRAGHSEKEALKLAKNSDTIGRVRETIVNRKTIELLKTHATVEEIEVPAVHETGARPDE